MRRPSPATVRWLILAGLLVFWELMPRTGIIPELFLPTLSKTLAVLVKDWREYASELSVTLYEVAIAMLIACGGGILAGALVGGVALLRSLLLPVFSSMYAIPIVILYPIFTAWFGIGSESKIIFAGVYGFFPVMLSTAAGIGYLVTRYRTILDSPHVFGAIIMILLLSIAFDAFARAIERRTAVWQVAGRRQKDGEPADIVARPVQAAV